MSTLKTPFKYDFVGSFLRPQALKDAKSKYKNNEISQEEYDKIVNDEITKLVAKQKELGYHAITDGEFRRTFWHLDFMWGFGGVEHKDTGNGVPFNAELAVLDDTYLVGKIKAKPHPFVEYFKFLKQFEDENTVAKYTIPAPAQTYLQFIVPSNIESTRKYYPTNEELIADIAAAYKDVIKQFYDAGCRNLQLDDCSWGSVIGENANADIFGLSADEFKEQLLTVNNLALEGKADDMVITSHICRGNYHSTFFSSGGCGILSFILPANTIVSTANTVNVIGMIHLNTAISAHLSLHIPINTGKSIAKIDCIKCDNLIGYVLTNILSRTFGEQFCAQFSRLLPNGNKLYIENNKLATHTLVTVSVIVE